MFRTKNVWTVCLVVCFYLAFRPAVGLENYDVEEIRETLRQLFANEKPFVSKKTLEKEVEDAVEDVLQETRELSHIQNFGVPQTRFLDVGMEKTFVEDVAKREDGYPPAYIPVQSDIGYRNDWVVHIVGGTELAEAVLRDLGYQYHGPVS